MLSTTMLSDIRSEQLSLRAAISKIGIYRYLPHAFGRQRQYQEQKAMQWEEIEHRPTWTSQSGKFMLYRFREIIEDTR